MVDEGTLILERISFSITVRIVRSSSSVSDSYSAEAGIANRQRIAVVRTNIFFMVGTSLKLLYSKNDIEIRIYSMILQKNTIVKRGSDAMAKFIVRKPEKEVISMRISADTLKLLDDMAAKSDISRNELINQMIVFALEHMEGSEEE